MTKFLLDLSLTNCQHEQQLLSGLQDASLPDCDANGLYLSKQCNGFLLECWCVNQITGTELQGSRAAQFNPTYSIDCDNYEGELHICVSCSSTTRFVYALHFLMLYVKVVDENANFCELK